MKLNDVHVSPGHLELTQKGEVIFEDTFEDLSGDWAVITFSEDGQYIVLGLPYELYVYERLE